MAPGGRSSPAAPPARVKKLSTQGWCPQSELPVDSGWGTGYFPLVIKEHEMYLETNPYDYPEQACNQRDRK